MDKEFLIAEALAQAAGGTVGHGTGIVITVEKTAVCRKYFDGGFTNKSVFGITVSGSVQRNVINALNTVIGAALAYSGNGMISSRISVTGGGVSAGGVWKYRAELTALVRYSANDVTGGDRNE